VSSIRSFTPVAAQQGAFTVLEQGLLTK